MNTHVLHCVYDHRIHCPTSIHIHLLFTEPEPRCFGQCAYFLPGKQEGRAKGLLFDWTVETGVDWTDAKPLPIQKTKSMNDVSTYAVLDPVGNPWAWLLGTPEANSDASDEATSAYKQFGRPGWFTVMADRNTEGSIIQGTDIKLSTRPHALSMHAQLQPHQL